MLQTLNPYTSTAKTAQIMARYRPIAPRPNVGGGCEAEGSGSGSGSSSSPTAMSPTISQSPYLRNVWPHLQSRPTRTRKRAGRTSLGPPPPPAFKRPRRTSLLQGLAPWPTRNHHLSIPNFPLPHRHMQPSHVNVIDLNTAAAEIPEEKDLLAQLQQPTTNLIISPRPVRLVPSTVSIQTIKDDTAGPPSTHLKKAEQVEKELESQALPGFVSDSNHKVRLVNSAYKEMVGQPECPWLESVMTTGDACKSICGEVLLNFTESDPDPNSSSGGFSCWARIEWGLNGNKVLVNAFGEAIRLACESNDYTFAWRFHTNKQASEAQQHTR